MGFNKSINRNTVCDSLNCLNIEYSIDSKNCYVFVLFSSLCLWVYRWPARLDMYVNFLNKTNLKCFANISSEHIPQRWHKRQNKLKIKTRKNKKPEYILTVITFRDYVRKFQSLSSKSVKCTIIGFSSLSELRAFQISSKNWFTFSTFHTPYLIIIFQT